MLFLQPLMCFDNFLSYFRSQVAPATWVNNFFGEVVFCCVFDVYRYAIVDGYFTERRICLFIVISGFGRFHFFWNVCFLGCFGFVAVCFMLLSYGIINNLFCL